MSAMRAQRRRFGQELPALRLYHFLFGRGRVPVLPVKKHPQNLKTQQSAQAGEIRSARAHLRRARVEMRRVRQKIRLINQLHTKRDEIFSRPFLIRFLPDGQAQFAGQPVGAPRLHPSARVSPAYSLCGRITLLLLCEILEYDQNSSNPQTTHHKKRQ